MPGILKTVTPDGRGAGFFVSGPIDPNINNDHVTLKASQGALVPGTILGKAQTGTPTVTVGTRVSGVGGTVGDGAISAVSADAGAVAGDWQIVFTTAGATAKFKVLKPNGDVDGVGTVGTAYNGTGSVNFTLADGAADFAVDDVIPLDVAYDFTDDSVIVYGKHDPDATDGLQIAAAILWDDQVNVAATQRIAAIVRGPVVINGNLITWPHSGITAAERAKAISELAAVGIMVRY